MTDFTNQKVNTKNLENIIKGITNGRHIQDVYKIRFRYNPWFSKDINGQNAYMILFHHDVYFITYYTHPQKLVTVFTGKVHKIASRAIDGLKSYKSMHKHLIIKFRKPKSFEIFRADFVIRTCKTSNNVLDHKQATRRFCKAI